MWRLWFVVVALTTSVCIFAETAFDHQQPDSPNPSGSGSVAPGTANDSPGIDPMDAVRDIGRRLGDSTVISLFEKLTGIMRSNSQIDGVKFGSLADSVPGVSEEQKKALKSLFGDLYNQQGKEAVATLAQVMAEIAKERNIQKPITEVEPTPNRVITPQEQARTNIEDQLRALQQGIRDIQEGRAIRSRDPKKKDSEGNGYQPGNTPGFGSGSGGSPPLGSSENSKGAAAGGRAQHTDNAERSKGAGKGASGGGKDEAPLEKDPKNDGMKPAPSEPKKKAAQAPQGDAKAEAYKPPTADNEGNVATGPTIPKEINLGMSGEKTTPPAIAPGNFWAGNAGNDFSSGGGGSLAAVSSSTSSSMLESGFLDGAFSESGGPSTGAVGGAFQGGVAYVSGSSPESSEGEALDNSDNSMAIEKPIKDKILSLGVSLNEGPLGDGGQAPGIFRYLKPLQKKACSRLEC